MNTNLKMPRKPLNARYSKERSANWRSSMVNLKSEIKKQFQIKLKLQRTKAQDNGRMMLMEQLDKSEMFINIHKEILADVNHEIDAYTIETVMKEVETEIAQEELNWHAYYHEQEELNSVQSLLQAHLATCGLCDQKIPENFDNTSLCKNCALDVKQEIF